MNSKDESVGAGCLAFLLAFGIYIAAAPWEGWVFHKLWGWFVVPALGLAIGIALLVGMLTTKASRPNHDSYGELLTSQISSMVALPAYALLFGWIFHMLWG